jgi:hypothetical protein
LEAWRPPVVLLCDKSCIAEASESRIRPSSGTAFVVCVPEPLPRSPESADIGGSADSAKAVETERGCRPNGAKLREYNVLMSGKGETGTRSK